MTQIRFATHNIQCQQNEIQKDCHWKPSSTRVCSFYSNNTDVSLDDLDSLLTLPFYKCFCHINLSALKGVFKIFVNTSAGQHKKVNEKSLPNWRVTYNVFRQPAVTFRVFLLNTSEIRSSESSGISKIIDGMKNLIAPLANSTSFKRTESIFICKISDAICLQPF